MFEPLSTSSEDSTNNALIMKRLAEGASLDGLNVDGDKLLNTAKLFIVAQACNELSRVIKMTDFLDKLENRFMETVDAKLEESPNNLQLITYAMETISESLKRSNDLITQVLKDEKLTSVIINTTNVITPDGNSATIMDIDSRDNIRNMASSLLAQLSHITESDDIIDVEGDEPSDDESKS